MDIATLTTQYVKDFLELITMSIWIQQNDENVLPNNVQRHYTDSNSYIYRIMNKQVFNHFYARKQNASRVFAIVWASVRLS